MGGRFDPLKHLSISSIGLAIAFMALIEVVQDGDHDDGEEDDDADNNYRSDGRDDC